MLSYAQQRAAERERRKITKALRKYVKRNCRSKRDLVDRIQWFPGDTSGTEDHAWYLRTRRAGGLPVMFWEGRAA